MQNILANHLKCKLKFHEWKGHYDDIELTSTVASRWAGRSIELPSLAVRYNSVDTTKPFPEKNSKYLLYSKRERASVGA